MLLALPPGCALNWCVPINELTVAALIADRTMHPQYAEKPRDSARNGRNSRAQSRDQVGAGNFLRSLGDC